MRTLIAGLMLLQAAPLTAQGGTLIVRRNGTEIGREQVTFEQGRRRGLSGTTLTISSKYPGAVPTTQLGVRLERASDGQLAVFQLDVERPDGPVTFLAAGAGARIVLKTIAKGSDAAQEMPGGPDVVLLDDNAVGLFTAVADLATPTGARLTAFYPRTGRRAAFVAKKNGSQVSLSGGVSGTLTIDGSGRLTRAELSNGITAVLSE
jgi:hypothetical protein